MTARDASPLWALTTSYAARGEKMIFISEHGLYSFSRSINILLNDITDASKSFSIRREYKQSVINLKMDSHAVFSVLNIFAQYNVTAAAVF